jgi:hypothetical protein
VQPGTGTQGYRPVKGILWNLAVKPHGTVAFDKDGNLLPEIQSAFDSPLRRPDQERYEQTGEVAEISRKKKTKSEGPKLPSDDELKKMSSDDIAKLVPFTKVENW